MAADEARKERDVALAQQAECEREYYKVGEYNSTLKERLEDARELLCRAANIVGGTTSTLYTGDPK